MNEIDRQVVEYVMRWQKRIAHDPLILENLRALGIRRRSRAPEGMADRLPRKGAQ